MTGRPRHYRRGWEKATVLHKQAAVRASTRGFLEEPEENEIGSDDRKSSS